MKKFLIFTFFFLFSNCTRKPDDCSLEFLGKSRRAVKLRTEGDGRDYQKFNNGAPITVGQWYELAGSLDSKVPEDFKRISENEAMPGIETIEVTLTCWLLAARLEHSEDGLHEKDNDFHLEVSGEPRWDTPHVIVEIPPGSDYCDTRQLIWELAAEDSKRTGHLMTRNTHIFGNPVHVLVRGYVFFDKPHAEPARRKVEAFFQASGGRGIRADGASHVQGIWEIHPVLSIDVIR